MQQQRLAIDTRCFVQDVTEPLGDRVEAVGTCDVESLLQAH